MGCVWGFIVVLFQNESHNIICVLVVGVFHQSFVVKKKKKRDHVVCSSPPSSYPSLYFFFPFLFCFSFPPKRSIFYLKKPKLSSFFFSFFFFSCFSFVFGEKRIPCLCSRRRGSDCQHPRNVEKERGRKGGERKQGW